MRRWVIVTGKGDAYVTFARSAAQASNYFQRKFPGLTVAQVFEAAEC